jgi:glycosyltransferase involved in cell wall biosynthesis
MRTSLPCVPFVLTVGDLQPRKNHLGLIHAFEELMRAHPQLPHHLVIVGKETWYADVVRAAAKKSQVADRIHFTGFVDDEELRRLYGACDLFVYPSFYEGFGLPILEAMACGRAVACSNTSAMPEVADSAALLFDPCSQRDLVFAMRDLLLNPELRSAWNVWECSARRCSAGPAARPRPWICIMRWVGRRKLP